MKKRIIIIGGFLGAGKTTAILYMAKYFIRAGLKVGIVTNDQGSQLVDAHFLRASSLETLSVEGGCFCCNFDEFTRKIAELNRSKNIDILLAEPVGSCTDLIATVFKPILLGKTPAPDTFANEFSLSPLSVAADPKRIKRLMMQEGAGEESTGEKGAGEESALFPTEVNYLFDRQLQEANIIAINKCDTLPRDELGRIAEFIQNKYPGAMVLKVSAKTGEGLPEWMNLIAKSFFTAGKDMQVDYEAYARAEAALGWLNAFYNIVSDKPADINEKAKIFMENARAAFRTHKTEIAHLKCYCVGRNDFFKASITGTGDELDVSAAMALPQKEINFIINARANGSPELLKQICEEEINKVFCGFTIRNIHSENFRPSPPNPTYRISM